MGDFNASNGTDRNGYEKCVVPYGSESVNQNITKFLDFAIIRGLRVAGSWFQHPQAHHWTWSSNAGGVAKETYHVLVDGCWRLLQNCRVHRSVQYLISDHRLVVATLKLQLKFRRMVPSEPWLDVDKFRDERVTEEFVNGLSGDLMGLGVFGNPEQLWSALQTTILEVACRCLGTHHQAK